MMPHPIRYLLFVFVIFMAAGLGSCRTEEQPEFGMATFQCDVTPPEGTLIYSGYEPLAEVEHPLLAKGIVIDSGLPHSSRIGAAMSLSTLEREDKPYILSALRINDSWIVNLPGECMIDFQFFCQDQVPGGFVAVAAYGDGGPGYICTEASFDEGGYEPGASRVAPASEGILKNAIRELTAGKLPESD